MAADNVSLGMFNLTGIPAAPRGVPQIEVTFDIDSNGILNVSAVDKGTGKKQSISITASNKLSQDEIDKMKKQAEEYAEQDRKKKEEIEQINNAETLAYTVEKTVNEAGDKIDEDTKTRIQGSVADLRKAISVNDLNKVRELSDSLTKEIQEIGSKMYQPSGEEQAASDESSQEAAGDQQKDEGDEKVVDAEYQDKE